MIGAPGAADPVLAPNKTEVAFKAWLRRLVTGAAELEAFDAGEIDAVMDRDSGCAHMLPEAQSALHESNHIALGTLDALPGEICILDAGGVVVMANQAWRASGIRHERAGLDVRAGENFFAACRDAPDAERPAANAVAAGLRSVLGGSRQSLRIPYVCAAPHRRTAFTLTIAATSGQGRVNALLTREWEDHPKQAGRIPRSVSKNPRQDFPAILGGAAQNRLLAALPSKDFARLQGDLEPVEIACGEVLYEPGERMRHVYFPNDSLVSMLALVEGHRALEVGLVGSEGVVGASVVLGSHQSAVRALVQGAGTAMRLSAARLLREFRRSQTLRRALLQFTDRLMVQVSQTAACNRFHLVDARLARWLLMTAERTRSPTFHLTHGFIAELLGVRREGVTVAAVALQRRGIIRYRRGNITVLDPQGLEAAACSCYRHLKLMDR
jgi:CRP-like cAMP-binding protein